MSTKVEKSILVNLPVSTVYNQWTQFEDFPQFMGGVKQVTQLSDERLEWVAEIGGIRRQWEARILEQVPDQRIAWAATEGATNAGSVSFEDLGGTTRVNLVLEYEPEGLVEKVGDKLNVVDKQAEGDLERFKAFIESESYATGAWRGTVAGVGAPVGSPTVEDAAESRGDSGKAGVSGKVAAGVGLAAAAAVAGVAAAATKKGDQENEAGVETETLTVAEQAPVITEDVITTEVPPPGVQEVVVDDSPLTDDVGTRTGLAGDYTDGKDKL
jgi:carbon monoxide dehydrogenase subunit G